MKQLCSNIFSPPSLSTPAILHGRQNEAVAIRAFEEKMSVVVNKAGLFIHPDFPFLGASPDGLIQSDGLIEVKSPYVGREDRIQPGAKFPFLEISSSGELQLKRSHAYFFQCMGQLIISKRQHCFFIVHTEVDIFIEKIYADTAFFLSEMLPKLKSFYENHYRPYVAAQL